MTFRSKMLACGAFSLAGIVATSLTGLLAVQQVHNGLEKVYTDRVVPLQQLKTVADAYAVLVIDAVNKANAGLIDAAGLRAGLADANTTIREKWTAYTATRLTPREAELVAEAEVLFADADRAIDNLQRRLGPLEGSLAGTLADVDGPLYAQIDPLSTKITELVDLQLAVALEEFNAATVLHDSLRLACAIVLPLVVVLTLLTGLRFIRAITGPLHTVADHLNHAAAATGAASRNLAQASRSLADGASGQTAALEQTSVALEEVSGMSRRTTENTAQASTIGAAARASAESGREALDLLQGSLREVTTAQEDLAEAIAAIQGSSAEVAKIVRTIDDIAFRTNLLALNAAIEAARAG